MIKYIVSLFASSASVIIVCCSDRVKLIMHGTFSWSKCYLFYCAPLLFHSLTPMSPFMKYSAYHIPGIYIFHMLWYVDTVFLTALLILSLQLAHPQCSDSKR